MTTAATEKKKFGPTDCLTPEARGSYVTVFEPKAPDPEKPNEKNYGVELWFRVKQDCDPRLKDQPIVDISDLIKAADAACIEEWGADKNAWPKGFKHPFKKGETLGGKNGPLPGGMIVRTSRKESFGAPIVVDQQRKDVIDKRQVYSGCYLRVKMHAYCWKHQTGGKGVSFTLDMVQLMRDGEPLGNSMKAEDAFTPIDVPAAPAGAPASAAPAGASKDASPFGDLN